MSFLNINDMQLHLLIKRYIFEFILISLALVITISIGFLMIQDQNSSQKKVQIEKVTPSENQQKIQTTKVIIVDISGSVMKADTYEVTPSARLGDIIKKAGGLSSTADQEYIARNFNMARLINDQEKIYIPSTSDIASGKFTEEKRTLQYLDSSNQDTDSGMPSQKTGSGVSLNTASSEELDTLPGVGPTTVKKIIDNRPYTSIDDLIVKKVLKQNVFDQIKDLVEL